MKLIENKHDYEFLKDSLKAMKWQQDHSSKSGAIYWSLNSDIQVIEQMLLAYRREHGIFEVGDKVFYTGRANDNDLYTLKETYDGHNFVVGSNGADKDFWTLFIDEIRHATPEEIAAGHRL